MEDQQIVSNQTPSGRSGGKMIAIIVFLILLAVIVSAGSFWLGLQFKKNNGEVAETPELLISPEPFFTPTPLPTTFSTPTPPPLSTGSGTPSPTASSSSFNVSLAVAAVAPATSSTCPTTFNFSASITANGAGSATYKWERSDGANAPTQTLIFDAAGSKTVNTTWALGGSGVPAGFTYSGWQKVSILTPNAISSNQANFTLNCP